MSAAARLRRDRTATAVLAVASVGIVAFALHRVPYDDEWFSVTLARDTTPDAFWRSLANDVHPPYVALLDRATVALTHSVAAIHVVHALATVAAMVVLGSLARGIGLSRTSVALAALHPVVFMYGGAARWYPMALLADALRAWALWARGPHATPRRRAGAFVAGATLGVSAGYADAVLVAIDAAWLLGRVARARSHGVRRAAFIITVAAACVGVTLVTSPVFLGQLRAVLAEPTPAIGSAPLAFLGFGLVGEALPPPPWTAVALVALGGYAAVVVRTWRVRGSPWLASVAAGWLVASLVGVWHPRYALMLWTLLTARVIEVARDGRAPAAVQWAASATCAWLAAGLLLTVGERSFVKGDLNRMGQDTCDVILRGSPDLVVAPYPRTAMQIARVCAPRVPVVTAGWIRHYADGDPALTTSIEEASRAARQIALVTVPTEGSSLTATFERVRGVLDARCRERTREPSALDPFSRWKRSAGVPRFRYEITRYDCP